MTQRKDIDYGISIRIADGACVVLQVKSLPTVVGTPCSDVGKGLAVIIFSLLSKGFPFGSAGKESACNAEDLRSILGLGRSPGEGKGYPLQYSGLENSTDCTVQGACAQVFSSCREQGLLSNCNAFASHPGGFSWCGA